ncbi:cyclic nucleotide-binding domain-containing protein [Magnetospirillum sp. UT-4]|uniref:cyclic nucleotide-binding domain-containing protein n=1 Tax=Magnetospirillum sp. UT-4 TaxID=2681467 RepID=UPI00137E83C9|nr:cyclic nucleotide-binding domain-containing protein [Magnetospirillum sp. UT-4]CAA7613999.1 putative transcriptional activator protein fnrA [Magnetospirillum sp. UT-4]
MDSGDLEVLARVPLFSGLPGDVLARIAAQARTKRHPRNAMLFRQGDEALALHVLLEGQVGLMGSVGAEPEQTMVEILDAGESFIAAAVLTGKPYLVGAMALTPCRVLELPRGPLLEDLRTTPDLALAMMAALAKHFRMLMREVKDLKLKTASQRLALYLMTLTPRRRGSVILRLPHNKSLIAARVGVRPETLSRAFAHLRSLGVVVDGHTIAVGDLARLGRYCHEGCEEI